MKRLRPIGVALVMAVLAQGCATTSKKTASKMKVQKRIAESDYALVESTASVDPDIQRRGNRVRGLTDY